MASHDSSDMSDASSSANGMISDTAPIPIESKAASRLSGSPVVETENKDTDLTEGTIEQTSGDLPFMGIRYRVEYEYIDGELAHQMEGDEEWYLSLSHSRRFLALPPITVTTVYVLRTSKDRSKKIRESKASNKGEGKAQSTKEGTKEMGGRTLPEDLATSQTSHTYMTIHSKMLLNVLRDIVSYYPGYTLLGDQFDVREPYQMLYHYREELKDYMSNHPQIHDEVYRVECNQHIAILLEFLDNRYGKAIQDERDRWTRTIPVCTFKYLWLLFKPGEACYSDTRNGLNPYITQGILRYGGITGEAVGDYEINTWNIHFDGSFVGGCSRSVWIEPYDGEKEITSLSYYPVQFFKGAQGSDETHEATTLRERLVARGRKFWRLAKERPCYREYNGKSTNYPFNKVLGRVVVDTLSYFNRYAFEALQGSTNDDCPDVKTDSYNGDQGSCLVGCQCPSCAGHSDIIRRSRFGGYNGLDPEEDSPPEDDTFFFLCSCRIFAFVLRSRTWQSLYVQDIVEVEEQKSAFERLVLPDKVKDTLLAVSSSYMKAQEDGRTQSTDIIKGKGEGKIFLLHGPPGTGKTLSAEVIAEFTKRPLLSLTCGDLGTTAGEVETRLGRYMYLGEIWGAVVLLDEADIYLETRAISEVKRNSLVSVFLRALEYYKGLLFLTTNRVNTFDEAFRSRIHVALEYRELGDEDRRQIWRGNIDALMSDRVAVTKEARDYVCYDKEVLGLKWNGREIRNALQTAVSLAEYEAKAPEKDTVIIKSKHLKRIVALSASFKSYIMSMHNNKSDAYIAKKKNLRNDMFEGPPLSRNAPIQVEKRKYLVVNDDAETPSGKVTGRYSRKTDYDYEEEEQPRSKGRTHLVERIRGASAGEGNSSLRASSQQPKRKGQSVRLMDEDESEEEHRRPKRSAGRVSRLEEEEESEVVEAKKPRKAAKKPARTAYRVVEEEEELPKRTKPSWRSPQTILVQKEEESEEQEEHILPTATSIQEEEEEEHILTRPTKQVATAPKPSHGTEKRDNSNNRSPAPPKIR